MASKALLSSMHGDLLKAVERNAAQIASL